MARLIDLSTLGIGERNPNAFNDPEMAHGWNDFLKILEAAPTVDAVPVVRCRDCKFASTPYGDEHDGWIECSNIYSRPLFGCNDFCSYGERKAGDGNG